MSLVDLVMPKMGESIMEATILKWFKQPGDHIGQDETLLEIATDKVDSEVPSIAEGTVEELLYQVNDVVPIGAVIARVRTAVETGAPVNTPKEDVPAQATSPAANTASAVGVTTTAVTTINGNGQVAANRFYSPLVLNIAASEGVPLHELEAIHGTGNEGRVTKKDILQYIADKKAGNISTAAPAKTAYPVGTTAPAIIATTAAAHTAPQTTGTPAVQSTNITVASGNVEILEMDRMRKLTAEHMVRSKHTSPHVTSFSEADVTNMVHWRDKIKAGFEKREGTKITFTPLFIEAIIRCIKKYPLINSSVDGDRILIKKDINIGMAAALPTGNLIVPVIRNADQLNLVGLTRQVNTLADNARQNKLRPEDIQGGTFTITNVGSFGSLAGTPIISQPQVAILAVGAIKKRPVVIETPEGDTIGIRHMMVLSMSYDHRIIDGSLGATFLTAVAKELEAFPIDRQY